MTRPPTPWDDPAHDVAADIIDMCDSPMLADNPVAQAFAARLRAVRGISDAFRGVDRAMRGFHAAAAGVARDLARAFDHARKSGLTAAYRDHVLAAAMAGPPDLPPPDLPPPAVPAWKRMPRTTWHGGRVTAKDLDVDMARVADEVMAGLDCSGRARRGRRCK